MRNGFVEVCGSASMAGMGGYAPDVVESGSGVGDTDRAVERAAPIADDSALDDEGPDVVVFFRAARVNNGRY